MKLKTMLASMLTIVALTSCEDLFEEGNMQPDGSKPSLTINNPTNNQAVNQTQGLRVYITAVDKDVVKNVQFAVKASESTLINFQKASEKNVVDFDTLVSVQNLSPGTYQLFVRATDGRTNVSEQQVNFTVR
ncbi:Ig-like domain-containing protein [Pontibacter sp. H259]|uniref:Ig-like domain-containing protein n=1 Tax=Pontibacter sp. H259 TaxID=3133421 RepID=UPI0030C25AA3